MQQGWREETFSFTKNVQNWCILPLSMELRDKLLYFECLEVRPIACSILTSFIHVLL
jgi:hypothetical protein